jgi:hypothetical protein
MGVKMNATFIAHAMSEVQLTGKEAATADSKLIGIIVGTLLPKMALASITALSKAGHGHAIDEAIRSMSLAQLKKVSKAWDRHNTLPKEPNMAELSLRLRDLAASRVAPCQAPAQRVGRRRPPTAVAAE